MYKKQKLSHPTNRAYKNLRWIQLGISGYFFFNPFPLKLYFFWHVWCFNASLDFLQDNQMRLSGRVTQYLIDKFEDNRGIDCERLYRFLTDAHLIYWMNFKRMEVCVLKIPNVSLSFFFSVIVHINYRMYFVGPCPQLVFSILYIFTRLCDYNLAEYGIGRNQNYGK